MIGKEYELTVPVGEEAVPSVAFGYEIVGEMTVPARVQRSTVRQQLLDGQRDGPVPNEAQAVPQIPLDAGEWGILHLIPKAQLSDGVRLRARRTTVLEPVSDGEAG